jgi:hypothetical protein
MALALAQVAQGRTRGGESRSGGERHIPRHPYSEAGTNWCTGPTAPPLRGAMQAAGMRESSIAGDTGSDEAANHGYESATQHSKHHSGVG